MIKLVFLSDLHCQSVYNLERSRLIENLVDEAPDVLVLGGDIADHNNGIEHVLKYFRELLPKVHILFIPGNHDLWTRYWTDYYQPFVSDFAFNKVIPAICKKYNIIFLDKKNLIVDTWLLSGSVAWYDYSFKYHQYSTMPDEYFYTQKGNYNNDANYIRSELTDVEFSNLLKTKLLNRIKKDYSKVQHIAVFTHVPVFKEAVKCVSNDTPGGRDWNFGSSYFYNPSLGEALKKLTKLKLVVSGHTHTGFEAIIEDRIQFFVNPSDYGKPIMFSMDLLDNGEVINRIIT